MKKQNPKQNHQQDKSKKLLFPIILIIIFIPVFIILSNVDLISFNEKAHPENSTLVKYFKTNNNSLISDFSEAEQSHLNDVRNLLILNKWILRAIFLILLSAFFRLIFYFKKNIIQNISKSLIYGGILTDILIIILAIFSINFNFVFTLFHKILFPQGNWIFSPESLLIQLYPIQFFVNTSIKIALSSFIIANILIIIGYILLIIKKRIK